MELIVLQNRIWRADDYLSDRNCNPITANFYCFKDDVALEKFIKSNRIDIDDELYNDGYLYRFPIETEAQRTLIANAANVDFKEFLEMLEEEYSNSASHKNYGEFEKSDVGAFLANYGYEYFSNYNEEQYELPNYEYGESIDGCVVAIWSWEKHVGYARNLHEVRFAYNDETKGDLAKKDETFARQMDILLTTEEVSEAGDCLLETIIEKLEEDKDWKWNKYSRTYINI